MHEKWKAVNSTYCILTHPKKIVLFFELSLRKVLRHKKYGLIPVNLADKIFIRLFLYKKVRI